MQYVDVEQHTWLKEKECDYIYKCFMTRYGKQKNDSCLLYSLRKDYSLLYDV